MTQKRDDDFVTAYTAGADKAPPAYPGQPRNVRAEQMQAMAATAAAKPKTSGWTLAGLVCGTLGFVIPVIPALAGIGFSLLGLIKAGPRERVKPIVVMIWSVAALLFGGLVVLPRGIAAYEIANRVACAGRIMRIGHAINAYAEKHQGHYPDRLQALLHETPAMISVEDLICPGSGEKASSSGDHSSYLYAGSGWSKNAGDEHFVTGQVVILMEPTSDHRDDGANFLWGNGQATWEGAVYARYIMKEVQSGHNPPRPWHGQQ